MRTEKNELKLNPSIYEKNLKALKKRYPEYVEKLSQTSYNLKYYIYQTGDNNQLNLYSVDNQSFYYKVTDPILDAKQQIDALEIKNLRIALIFGIGLTHELKYFSETLLVSNVTKGVILIEKEWEIFKAAISCYDISEMILNERVLLIIGDEVHMMLTRFEAFFRRVGDLIYYVKNIQPVYHPTNFIWFNEYYMAVLKELSEIVRYLLRFYGNDPYDSLVGITQMLDNINEILYNPGINLLFNKFKGKPAIIASTGPSLNKNIHLLKQLQDKALIVAPDASLKVLLNSAVRPHMVTALERMGRTAQLFEGYDYETVKDVYMAATPVIENKCYQNYPGPRIIVYRDFDHFKWLKIDRGILKIKQSAGNMAFKIADALGCDPIILVGQDLAYGEDGYTHASGTQLGEKQDFDSGDIYVEGNDGKPIRTNLTWDQFRRAYEIDVAESNATVINATEGGAKINGTFCMPLSEAINKYMIDDIMPLDIIKEGISTFNVNDSEVEKRQLKGIFDETKIQLEEMMELCLRALEIISANKTNIEEQIASKTIIKGDLDRLFNEVMTIRRNIFAIQPTMQLFLMHIVQSYNIKFEIDINGHFNAYDNQEEIYANVFLDHQKWFAIFHDITKIAHNSLLKSENQIYGDSEQEDLNE